MRVHIAAIGKAKASPELQLYQHYLKRIPWKISLSEHDVKSAEGPVRKVKEAELLLAACKGHECVVSLDESGSQISSQQIAEHISKWQQRGISSFACVIGGADGLDKSVLSASAAVWSFGRVTWPHMLVRGLLAEQLYRAHTIIQGHPYHRS